MPVLIFVNFDKPHGENVEVERVIPPVINSAINDERAQVADVIIEYDDYAGKARLIKYPVPSFIDDAVVEISPGTYMEHKPPRFNYSLNEIGKNAAMRMIENRDDDGSND